MESLKSLAAVFAIDFSSLYSESTMKANLNQGVSPEEALAFRQVRKLKGFYIHFSQYVVVVSLLAILNLLRTPGYLWVIWVALGWGIGVLVHGLSVFDKFPFLNAA